MKYALTKLRDKQGYPVPKPKPTYNVTLNIENNLAMAFVNDRPIEVLRVVGCEARSDGLLLKGLENGEDQLRYQEWFLAYPKELL
jgi:hypothetical protein